MFICPTCQRGFSEEKRFTKHFLSCWKEANPSVKQKEAPRSPDIITREISDDLKSFFEGRMPNGSSN